MRKPFGSAVTLMGVVMLLSATSRTHACVEFDAPTYTGATDAEAYTALEYEFSCPTGDFVQEYFVSEHDTWGYIEAIGFTCTDGTSSGWFGDQNETIASSGSFALGMYQIGSIEILNFSSATDTDYLPYMGQLYLYGSSTTTSLSIGGEEYGPYGFAGTTTYTSSATYTFCEDALATGVTVWADSTAVFGIQLKCAELSDTYIPPGFDYTATPAPSVTSSSSPSSSTVARRAPVAPFSLWVVIALVVVYRKRNTAPIADGTGGSQVQYPAVRNVAVVQPRKDAGSDSVVAEPPPAYDAIVTSPRYSR